MGGIPPRSFARQLRRLDREGFAQFVAALWAASGWETDVDGAVVIARRADECQRIGVLPPRRFAPRWRRVHLPPDVDAVASPYSGGELPRGTPDATVFGSSALRDRLCFAVEPPAADHLCSEYLGVPARDERWDERSRAIASSRVSGLGREQTVIAGALVVGVLAFLLGPSSLLGVAPIGLGTAPGDSTDGASTEVPEPTCERSPDEVAVTVGNTLQPPEEGASGTQVFWEFTDPQIRESRHYRAFRGFYDGPRFDPLRHAHEVVLDGVVRDGEAATVFVVAPTPDENVRYAFRMRQRDRGDGEDCWTIRSVALAP